MPRSSTRFMSSRVSSDTGKSRLAKNQTQLLSLVELANLVLAKRCEGRIEGGQCVLNLAWRPDRPPEVVKY